MKTICAWCNTAIDGGELQPGERISHGMCPSCVQHGGVVVTERHKIYTVSKEAAEVFNDLLDRRSNMPVSDFSGILEGVEMSWPVLRELGDVFTDAAKVGVEAVCVEANKTEKGGEPTV